MLSVSAVDSVAAIQLRGVMGYTTFCTYFAEVCALLWIGTAIGAGLGSPPLVRWFSRLVWVSHAPVTRKGMKCGKKLVLTHLGGLTAGLDGDVGARHARTGHLRCVRHLSSTELVSERLFSQAMRKQARLTQP